MKLKKSLSLITVNGRCINNKGKNFTLTGKTNQLLKKEYNLRRVRNFLLLKLQDLGVNLCIYSRGAFKWTLSPTKRTFSIIKHFEQVSSRLVEIVDSFYSESVEETEAKITQIAILITGIKTEKKITYEHLITRNQWKNDKAEWDVNGIRYEHTINHVTLENGNSNYYFPIQKKGKKVGGLKLYNNAKAVLFIFELENLQELSTSAKKFIKGIAIKQEDGTLRDKKELQHDLL